MAKRTQAVAQVKIASPRNEVKLDAKNPIPIELNGESLRLTSGDVNAYIPFFKGSNDFPLTLLELSLLSPTQFACISTKTSYAIGDGIQIVGEKSKDDPRFIKFLKHSNSRKHKLVTSVRKALTSLLTFGNSPVEVVRGQAGSLKYVHVYPKNFLDCRFAVPDANDQLTHVIISKNFRKRGFKTFGDNDYKKLPLYTAGKADTRKFWQKDGKVERTMLWLKNEVAGFDYYGLPSSIASIHHQKVEYETVRFNLDNLENNMVMGGAIFLTGNLTQGEADKVVADIMKRHTGKGKRGRVGVYVSQGVGEVKWVPFSTEKEGSYDKLEASAQERIILANEWDSVLAGLKSSQSLGKGSGYIQEAYFQRLNTVIRPLQNLILDGLIAPLMEICDEWMGTKWAEAEIDMIPARISNNGSDLLTTTEGIAAFLKIVESVAAGNYPVEAAIKFISAHFGMTEKEAREQLGVINVRSNETKKKADN